MAEAWTTWQPQTSASGVVALADSSAPLQMMLGRRSWPAMATVLLALLVCLVELVDADSNSQPEKGAKASGAKHSHHSSLRHILKLANR